MELRYTNLFDDANLIAYYRLSDANDSKGTFNLTDNGTVTFTAGKYSNAANFGTTNKSLKYTTDNAGIDGGSISISFWVKLLAEPGSGVRYTFVEQGSNTSDVGYRVDYLESGGGYYTQYIRNKYNIAAQQYQGTVTLGTANWNHFVLTYNGAEIRPYRNGVIQGTVAASGNGNGDSTLGIRIGGEVGYAKALIDDVAIFNKALGTAEIDLLYKVGSGGGGFVTNLI